MELSGLSLAVATEISLSFSTQTDTGTIFLAVSGADQIDQKVGYQLLMIIDHKIAIYMTQLTLGTSFKLITQVTCSY